MTTKMLARPRITASSIELAHYFAGLDLEVSVEKEICAVLTSDWLGGVCEASIDPALRDRCDLIDGMAKVAGVIDTVVVQPTGATSMLIGFNTTSRAMAAAVRQINPESMSSACIIGSSERAACALGAAVELGVKQIAVIRGGDFPALALSAAHKMGLKTDLVVEVPHVDLVVNTLSTPILPPENSSPVIVTSVDDDASDNAYSQFTVVSRKLQDQYRTLEQLRLFTGKIFALEDLN